MTSPDAWTVFDRLQHRDPASLTRDERLVLALGQIRTEVNSGGFDFYLRYASRKNAPAASEAARLAGCPALAALIGEALALVGRDVLHLDDEDVLYERLEQVEDALEDLDERFCDLEKTADLDTALGRLVARLPLLPFHRRRARHGDLGRNRSVMREADPALRIWGRGSGSVSADGACADRRSDRRSDRLGKGEPTWPL